MSNQPTPDLSDPRERARIIDDATRRGRVAMIKPLSIAVVGCILAIASIISVGSAVARCVS